MDVIHKVAAMVIRENTFLMVRKKGKDIWTNLGGRVEAGEAEATALVREINEELGCGAVIIRKLGDFEAPAAHDPARVRLSVYLVQLTSDPVITDDELAEWTYVGPDYLGRGIRLPPSITEHVIPYCQQSGLLAW